MTSKAKLDAFMNATRPLVDEAIQKAEQNILGGPFIRRQADQTIQAHRAEIDASLRRIADVGCDAADKVPA
jgi:hypothetical protein